MRLATLIAGALAAVMPLAGLADTGQDRAYGGYYSETARVGGDQAQVVYYRAAEELASGAANVYLNQEFVTALKPGGYTVFCVSPGRHTLGAYLDEAPDYHGKTRHLYAATFKAGATYYLKVREQGLNQPMPVSKATADSELASTREQIHLLQRASQVESCRHYEFLDNTTVSVRSFSLPADTTFNTRGAMTADGVKEIDAFFAGLQESNAQITRIEVEGHTDPVRTEAENQLQGQRWADSVRDALIQRGIPQSLVSATSAGSRVLVKHTCYGGQQERHACQAPNRRVGVRVEVKTGR